MTSDDIHDVLNDLIAKNHQLRNINRDLRLESNELDDKLSLSIHRLQHFYQYAFSAYATETVTYSLNLTVLFDEVLFDDGDFYNPQTGTYVCPQSGYYLFMFYVVSDSGERMQLMMEGEAYTATLHARSADQASNMMLFRCRIGNQVYVRNSASSARVQGHPTFPYTSFSGIMLFPD